MRNKTQKQKKWYLFSADFVLRSWSFHPWITLILWTYPWYIISRVNFSFSSMPSWLLLLWYRCMALDGKFNSVFNFKGHSGRKQTFSLSFFLQCTRKLIWCDASYFLPFDSFILALRRRNTALSQQYDARHETRDIIRIWLVQVPYVMPVKVCESWYTEKIMDGKRWLVFHFSFCLFH